MLKEIKCVKFGERIPNKTISFHDGLNVVVGENDAANSIGKSTLLLIIDFCFGGKSYTNNPNSDVLLTVGDHEILFTFEFGGVEYHFKRTTNEPDAYFECDANYKVIGEKKKIDDLNSFLKVKYGLASCSFTFRELIGRFSRIYGKGNYDTQKPLKSYIGDSNDAEAISCLECLFGEFDKIKELKKQISLKDDETKAYRNAQKFNIISSTIKSDKQLEEKKAELKEKSDELANLLTEERQSDVMFENNLSEEDLTNKEKYVSLVRQRRKAQNELKALRKMTCEDSLMTSEDLANLKSFFPNADFESIDRINSFQRKLIENVNGEIKQLQESLNSAIASLEKQIADIQEVLEERHINPRLSDTFFQDIFLKKNYISSLEGQIALYEKTKKLKFDKKILTESLEQQENVIVKSIQDTINDQMETYNDLLYLEKRQPPKLELADYKHYSFLSSNDHGSGTEFKNILLLDLSILKHSMLPIVIHDSILFKNIGDEPMGNLFKIYQDFTKQIFISIDRVNALSEKAQRVIQESSVIKLFKNEGSLFGYCWNKKVNSNK